MARLPSFAVQLCDQVSDAILDACLEQDPESKVACETATKTNMVGGCWRHAMPTQSAARLPLARTCAGAGPHHAHLTVSLLPAWPRPQRQVMVFGEITTRAKVDYEAVVRKTCREIGFISDDVGLDADKCKVGAAAGWYPSGAESGQGRDGWWWWCVCVCVCVCGGVVVWGGGLGLRAAACPKDIPGIKRVFFNGASHPDAHPSPPA